MFPLNRLVFLFLAALLPACINLPDIEEPGSPPDGGSNPGRFTLAATPSQIAVPQGGHQVFQISITRQNEFDGSISVGLLNPPPGVSAQPVTLAAGASTADLSISVGESAEPGIKSLVIRGTAGPLSSEASVEVTVLRLGELLVRWGIPAHDTIYVNGTLALSVSIEGGTADSVEFLRGATILAQLTAPPYQFNWDTTREAEGSHQLMARAKRGSSTFTGTVVSVVVDRTAPTFASRTPGPGAASVASKAGIEAVFSEPLKPSSVTNTSVVVSTESISSIEKALSLSADGTRLTIVPAAPLPVPSIVTVALATNAEPVTDLAGNPLTLAQPWTFMVPAWLPAGGALSAAPGATSAENVAMQIGPDGKPIIAWSEFDGSSKNIYVQKWSGAEWQPLGAALSQLPETDTPASHPALVIDSSSRPVLVWDEATSSIHPTTINLYARQWTGLSWELLPPFPAFSGSEYSRAQPTAAIDSSDTLFVTAESYDGVGNKIAVFQMERFTTDWSKRSLVIPGEHLNPSHPFIATYGPGKFYIAYDAYQDVQGTRSIFATTESWVQLGNGLTINPSSRAGYASKIVVSNNGTPHVVWQEFIKSQTSTTDGIIYAARWNGSWQMLGISVSTSDTPNIQPTLITAPDGNPIVAWSESTSTARAIQVSRWNGNTWQPLGSALSAVDGDGTDAFSPVLATDSSGQLWVAWHEFDGTSSHIYTYRLNN